MLRRGGEVSQGKRQKVKGKKGGASASSSPFSFLSGSWRGRNGRKKRKETQRGKLVGEGISAPEIVRSDCPPFLRLFAFFAAIHSAGRARAGGQSFSRIKRRSSG
jgi:hypothetical protein